MGKAKTITIDDQAESIRSMADLPPDLQASIERIVESLAGRLFPQDQQEQWGGLIKDDDPQRGGVG